MFNFYQLYLVFFIFYQFFSAFIDFLQFLLVFSITGSTLICPKGKQGWPLRSLAASSSVSISFSCRRLHPYLPIGQTGLAPTGLGPSTETED
jgi:hypothetical protein